MKYFSDYLNEAKRSLDDDHLYMVHDEEAIGYVVADKWNDTDDYVSFNVLRTSLKSRLNKPSTMGNFHTIVLKSELRPAAKEDFKRLRVSMPSHLEEATNNYEWGFYGTLALQLHDPAEHIKTPKETTDVVDELYAHAEEVYMKVWKSGKSNAVKALDAIQGRHFADYILNVFYQQHQDKVKRNQLDDWFLDPTDNETIKVLKKLIKDNLKKMIKPA